MNELLIAAKEIQRFCESQNWDFCIIGGLAVQRWGEPRLTQDVDLTLLTGFGGEESFIEKLLGSFPSRVDDARRFAVQNRVLLLETHSGVPLDISLGAMPFEEAAVQRSSNYPFDEGLELRTCSAEDLIVFKAFADRTKDWMDVEGILIRQSSKLDENYIFEHLEELAALKEEPEIVLRLRKLMAKVR